MASKALTNFAFILSAGLGLMLGGCDFSDSSSTSSTASAAGAASVPSSPALAIAGSPAENAVVGAAYSFTPTTTHASPMVISFSIVNKPAWASFDATTGKLSGTPTAANVGTTSAIQIRAGSGRISAALAPFSIKVAAPPSVASLTISGNPATTAAVGANYSFRPAVTQATGASLSFAIANKPAWARFDPATGALTGNPVAADVGVDAQILISVSDGTRSSALPAFSISVTPPLGSAVTLSWMAPAVNANGSPITDLSGYHIYYGTSTSALTTVITVANAAETSQVIANLASGTWYFAVAAFNSQKIESGLSAILSVTI